MVGGDQLIRQGRADEGCCYGEGREALQSLTVSGFPWLDDARSLVVAVVVRLRAGRRWLERVGSVAGSSWRAGQIDYGLLLADNPCWTTETAQHHLITQQSGRPGRKS